ncbi:uncharacterized protein V1518DRAFT_410803 [Limtongia smithiae]|uniref:uncharacterized protein n=1 Tax=Limtongia smithiae TaxID=1125753 RepID=UPI0034CE801B
MDPSDPSTNDPRRRAPLVLTTQLVIAASFGIPAFLSFCFLRTQWADLYAARTLHHPNLPPLPKSFFGWIPALYKITEDQVLEHAGLDAFVFLGFFSMAIKLLAVCTFFAVTVISPIRWHYTGLYDGDGSLSVIHRTRLTIIGHASVDGDMNSNDESVVTDPEQYDTYLWCYVIFAWVFTAVTGYFLLRQTHHIVRVRQAYLGSQSSITDRTIRLSGVPVELRSEEALKEHIETLGIGEVRSITICRQWKELDNLMDRRRKMLRKVELAWTEYFGDDGVKRSPRASLPVSSLPPSSAFQMTDDSATPLLNGENTHVELPNVISGTPPVGRRRPLLRAGFLGIFGNIVDKIDYYTAKLEKLDQQIKLSRHKEYKATPVAFVTMDSVASAQMAAQAVLDPQAYHLIAHNAPAPHDVIWPNLYKSKFERLVRQWFVTIIIAIATVPLALCVSFLAAFLEKDSIAKFWPALSNVLEKSDLLNALVTGFLPTFLFTLLNILVPFIFNGLSTIQGYISHGDVELSVVGKNFFYIFVNLFLLFTVAGTASKLWAILKDTTSIAATLAQSLKSMSLFYVDLIILQGMGMIPFRLLEFGVVFKYPFKKFFSKTPRDFYNLSKPPNFNYGFFLPQPLLILIVCLSYSCMSTKILTFGLIYFILGYFTFKYQLLYSMAHTQHSTGKSWPMIFFRVCIGLIIFQITTAGTLALQKAFYLSLLLVPLPIFTLIMMYNFYEHYLPLSYFIALRSILSNEIRRQGSRTLDEERERNQVYINPNLVSPLEDPWIADENGRPINVHYD